MKMNYYPIAVNLTNRRALVVGGGSVAERKIRALLDAGAKVKVVSPVLTRGLRRLHLEGRLAWIAKKAQKANVRGAAIVISATDDAGVNRNVSRWAKGKDVPVNVVDNPRLSSFISTAFFRTPRAIVSVYTDGREPELSRDLKNYLKERWDDFLSYRRRP
jgi:precorrin-2 dehydrogenase/sirohydrochlorin ferrochelatase